MIDTHCHLFSEEFDKDRAEALQRAKDAGVTQLLLPNIDTESIPALYALADSAPGLCLPMMGLHPTHVKENYREELARIEQELRSGRHDFVAIGEIGLDYYWDTTFKAEQQEVFRIQLQWARELDLPVAIHTRGSFADALAIVQEEAARGPLRGVFHCFGGTVEEGSAATSLPGFYLGLGGVTTFKKAAMETVLPHLPYDRLILETDSPYLAPVPHRGKRNEPAYLPLVCRRLAEILGLTEAETDELTTDNARRLFRL